jgi:chromosome partitioning protein
MITAVVSKKGGVGKTTTSVNLAAALAGIGKRVLLLDLDSQASASLSMGVPRSQLAPSTADIILRHAPVEELVRETRIPGLHIIPASADLSTADQTLGMVSGRELILHRALAPIKPLFDFIVPVVPHFLAWEGVSNLVSTVSRLYERLGRRTDLLGIVLTMVDYRTKAARTNVDAIRGKYRDHVFAIEIRTNTRLAEAPENGQTIFEYDSAATGARAYRPLRRGR